MQRLTNFGEEIDKDMKITPLASLLFLPALFSCVFQPEAEGALELPELNPTDRIVEYTGYVSSYNTETLIPDWVAYELTAEETEGTLSRDDRMFSMDRNFKGRQAMREDYYDSGWTKGHMAPAADLAWDEKAMDESFYFMNVCPQKEYLNKKDWQYLEKQVRSWARRYGKVWVITGPIIGKNIYGTIGPREYYGDRLLRRPSRRNRGYCREYLYPFSLGDKITGFSYNRIGKVIQMVIGQWSETPPV